MKLSKRYQVLGKKKFAIVESPAEYVCESLEKELKNRSLKSKIAGSRNKKTNQFKLFYRENPKSKDYYENYCMIAEIVENDEQKAKIEYAFVFDRFMFIYTKIFAALCVIIPTVTIVATIISPRLSFNLLTIPLCLIAIIGLALLFLSKEKKEKVEPLVKEFETTIIDAFSDEEGQQPQESQDLDDLDINIY